MPVRDTLMQLFDLPILEHRFARHQRDYLIVAELGGDTAACGQYLYTFTHCPHARLTTNVTDATWQRSWADELLDYNEANRKGPPDAYVWGVNWSMAYPGPMYVEDSVLAASWSARFRHQMHEATVDTEAYSLQLVFHDITVRKISDHVAVYDRAVIPLGP
jgi:hypothetical protein